MMTVCDCHIPDNFFNVKLVVLKYCVCDLSNTNIEKLHINGGEMSEDVFSCSFLPTPHCLSPPSAMYFHSTRVDALPLAARGTVPGPSPRSRSVTSSSTNLLNHSNVLPPRSSRTSQDTKPKPKPKPSSSSSGERQLPPVPSPRPSPRTTQSPQIETKVYSSSTDTICIHVTDENRNIEKDVVCEKSALLSHMNYFSSYFNNEEEEEDIDVSVHCDVVVFEWLMSFIHAKDEVSKPELTVTNVVSILISAEFLQMPTLTHEAVKFLIGNLAQVLKLPIDLSCLSDDVISELAVGFDITQLETLPDRRGKLVPKIWLKKLQLLCDSETSLAKCKCCGEVFSTRFINELLCFDSIGFVDFRGKKLTRHEVDDSFDVNQWFFELKSSQKLSWRDIYWKVFGLLTVFDCSTCGQTFSLSLLNHCRYHPMAPSHSVYPCCNTSASSLNDVSGCCTRNHTFADDQKAHINDVIGQNDVNTLLETIVYPRQSLICQPAKPLLKEANPDNTSSPSSSDTDYSSSDSDTDRSKRGLKRRKRGSKKDLRSCKSSARLRAFKLDVVRDSEAMEMEKLAKMVALKR
ncbi:hypothetical protein P9112_012716 [Eukaryota sp. TZLM1-RC]